MHNLNALTVKNAKPGARLSDGGGLRLDVDRNGNSSWCFRFTSPVSGKERFMGLGPLGDVPLARAREAAQEARNMLREGVDPIDARNASRADAKITASRSTTFRAYADAFIGGRETGWKNPKHRQQWRNSLATYAYPVIGSTAVADVNTAHILNVLRPIWNEKPETASRVRGRIEAILSAAKAEGLRAGENPGAWRGHLDQFFQSKKRVRAVRHHPALPYEELPAFMKALRADTSDSARLLEFIILTAARYSEAAHAVGREIDPKVTLWTVPGSRMKSGRPHTVPLSDAAMALLADTTEMLFASVLTGGAISDAALAKCIRRHTATPATTHGFRSTFRDWAGDETSFSREAAEAALSHVVGDETEAAYRRSTALAKRRKLMTAWAAYCAGS